MTWKRVEDGLPEPDVPVIVANLHEVCYESVACNYTFLGQRKWCLYRKPNVAFEDDSPSSKITHWMPLPDPPREEEEE